MESPLKFKAQGSHDPYVLRDILEHVGGAREASRDEWRYVFLGIGIGSIREIMLE